MTRNRFKVLLILAFLIIGICCPKNQQTNNTSVNTSETTNVNTSGTPFPPCPASADWVNNPQSGPGEVALGVNAQLCQFYQFSWQWFLAMMNAPSGSTPRNFQNQQQYPQWQAPGTNSCTATNPKQTLFVRASKNKDNKVGDFVLPERIGQAGGGNVIYDQKGNVVFYEVRFSRNECTLAETDPNAINFPPGTIELKASYRIITPAEAPNYVTINADINGDGTDELLGMVGFHLVISTPDHPEFIWATFEHKQNVPECQAAADASKSWSFTSAQCAAQLPNSVNPSACDFNLTPTPTPTPVLTGGTPSQICRVYHDGSRPGDDKYDTNIFDIDTLNTQLIGPGGIVTNLTGGPLAVIKNYQMVGALWLNQPLGAPGPTPSPNPSTLVNQRGSIQLANSTMETTFQQAPNFQSTAYTGTSNLQPASNCFACHGYSPSQTSGDVAQSHIFDDILAATKK